MPFSRVEWSKAKVLRINQQLTAYFQNEDTQLHRACQYPLETGGKRIRPLFLLAAVEALGGTINDDAYTCACALELIHTYSLVHDDLPAMDDDDVRRGKPTVHKIYSDGVAILVGDALLTKAFEILSSVSRQHLPQVLQIIGKAAGSVGMIGGQSLDIGLEGTIENVEQLQRLHERKTGALIQCALELAAVLMDASPQTTAKLSQFGAAIGLAFQLVDDVLDQEEDQAEGGPPSFVKLMGLEWTQQRAQDVLQEALELISLLPKPDALQSLAHFTVHREH